MISPSRENAPLLSSTPMQSPHAGRLGNCERVRPVGPGHSCPIRRKQWSFFQAMLSDWITSFGSVHAALGFQDVWGCIKFRFYL